MSDELDSLPDVQLTEVFAIEVAKITPQWHILKGSYYFRPEAKGYTSQAHDAGRFTEDYAQDYVKSSHGDLRMLRVETPPFATSANAVLPFIPGDAWCEWQTPPRVCIWIGDGKHYNTLGTASAPTFARAACLALIRAKRAEKGAS